MKKPYDEWREKGGYSFDFTKKSRIMQGIAILS